MNLADFGLSDSTIPKASFTPNLTTIPQTKPPNEFIISMAEINYMAIAHKIMYQKFDCQVRNFQSFCEIKLSKIDNVIYIFVKESPDNTGMSVCNAFETLFPLITKHFEIDPSKPFYWIEVWEKDHSREEDEYSLVSHRNGKNPKWAFLGNSESIAIDEIRKTLTN